MMGKREIVLIVEQHPELYHLVESAFKHGVRCTMRGVYTAFAFWAIVRCVGYKIAKDRNENHKQSDNVEEGC